LLPGNTVRLARESSANKVNWLKVVASALSDISIPPDIRPVFSEYLLAKWINFDLPFAGHPCPF